MVRMHGNANIEMYVTATKLFFGAHRTSAAQVEVKIMLDGLAKLADKGFFRKQSWLTG